MTNVKRFVVGGGADLEPCLGRVLFVFPLQRTGNFPSITNVRLASKL